MKAKLATLARTLSLGRIVYLAWHKPIAAIRQVRREGGWHQRSMTQLGMREMEIAAENLLVTGPLDQTLVPLHFLSGRRFWYQTAFCLHSYHRTAKCLPRVIVHDDGHMSAEYSARLRKVCPRIEFHVMDDRLDEHLPVNRFPVLRRVREQYVNIRKLLDVHLSAPGWKLVLDSDMLFHNTPLEMLAWQRSPLRPLLMCDVQTSYGYPLELMAELAGTPPLPRLNVGVCGLNSDSIDWDMLEYWAKALLEACGMSYYLEQGLVAMLVAADEPVILPEDAYRVEDVSRGEPPAAQTILSHYVDLAKADYFQRAWRGDAQA